MGDEMECLKTVLKILFREVSGYYVAQEIKCLLLLHCASLTCGLLAKSIAKMLEEKNVWEGKRKEKSTMDICSRYHFFYLSLWYHRVALSLSHFSDMSMAPELPGHGSVADRHRCHWNNVCYDKQTHIVPTQQTHNFASVRFFCLLYEYDSIKERKLPLWKICVYPSVCQRRV